MQSLVKIAVTKWEIELATKMREGAKGRGMMWKRMKKIRNKLKGSREEETKLYEDGKPTEIR